MSGGGSCHGREDEKTGAETYPGRLINERIFLEKNQRRGKVRDGKCSPLALKGRTRKIDDAGSPMICAGRGGPVDDRRFAREVVSHPASFSRNSRTVSSALSPCRTCTLRPNWTQVSGTRPCFDDLLLKTRYFRFFFLVADLFLFFFRVRAVTQSDAIFGEIQRYNGR